MTARPNNNRIKWKGAGPWNLYFLSVCTLHAFDYISLDPLAWIMHEAISSSMEVEKMVSERQN